MAEQVDVAIIGGGPAGLTAATYLRRFLRSVVVLDAGASRARHIPESHNCPGFPQGVAGDELLRRIREQAEGFGARIVTARAEGLREVDDGFEVTAGPERWPHLAVLPSDRDLDPTVAAKMRALGVQVFPAGGSLEFDGQRCSWRAADGSVATFDSVYPYLGYEGRNALVADWGLEAGEEGELKVDRHQQTVRPGLYAIGDVVSGLNQIAVAVGQAAVAATHAHNALPFVPRD